MNKITGGAAFPIPLTDEQETRWHEHNLGPANGMTLRDYFAAKALQGFCAAPDTGEWSPSFMAESAYKMADAMLKARDA